MKQVRRGYITKILIMIRKSEATNEVEEKC